MAGFLSCLCRSLLIHETKERFLILCCLPSSRDDYFSFNFLKINLFIYLFIFGCIGSLLLCARAFSSCGERGLLFVVVRGLLIAVVSLLAEHWL